MECLGFSIFFFAGNSFQTDIVPSYMCGMFDHVFLCSLNEFLEHCLKSTTEQSKSMSFHRGWALSRSLPAQETSVGCMFDLRHAGEYFTQMMTSPLLVVNALQN